MGFPHPHILWIEHLLSKLSFYILHAVYILLNTAWYLTANKGGKLHPVIADISTIKPFCYIPQILCIMFTWDTKFKKICTTSMLMNCKFVKLKKNSTQLPNMSSKCLKWPSIIPFSKRQPVFRENYSIGSWVSELSLNHGKLNLHAMVPIRTTLFEEIHMVLLQCSYNQAPFSNNFLWTTTNECPHQNIYSLSRWASQMEWYNIEQIWMSQWCIFGEPHKT